MANSCLILLCGLPGVGKSTFAQKLFGTLANRSCLEEIRLAQGNFKVGTQNDGQKLNGCIELLADCHVINVCFDDIIPSNLYKDIGSTIEHPTDHEKLWKSYRNNIAEFFDEFLNRHSSNNGAFLESERCKLLKDWDFVYSKIDEEHFCRCRESAWKNNRCGCGSKHIILLDDNMFYSSMRYKYFQIARKYMTGFLQIYISCSKANLLKQNSERAATVPLETIEQMASVFEAPDPQKNGWENNVVEFNSTSTDMNSNLYKVLTMIVYSMQNPVPSLQIEDTLAKDEARKINLKSIIYQADQVVRKYISSKMKEYQGLQMSKQYLRMQSSALNSKRKSFIEVLKRSSETLTQLDCLLLEWCDAKFSQTSSKSRDVDLLCNDTCNVPVPELEDIPGSASERSEYLCNRERFETAVSSLFRTFDSKDIGLEGIQMV